MCQFKSGLIFKNRVMLAPKGNESHSDLLRSLDIEDTRENAMRKFVRAELLPPNGDKSVSVDKWKFRVDQDIVPNWFLEDLGKYEEMFRREVADCISKNYVSICGKPVTAFKTDEKGTYYLLDETLEFMVFGKNNNYSKSEIREFLNDCDFVKELKAEFGERLVPITTDLLSLDGLNDYGKCVGDFLALLTLDLYRENRKKINGIESSYWLATPDSTPSGYGFGGVQYVRSDGYVDCGWYGNWRGVRPFFIIKSSIIESLNL